MRSFLRDDVDAYVEGPARYSTTDPAFGDDVEVEVPTRVVRGHAEAAVAAS
jgi:hypothetical protein